MKVFLYARVSTGEQNTDTQLLAQRAYCKNRGWDVSQEYVDQGVCGATSQRPQLDLMMRSLKGVGAVVVWKFDRLFRSVPHMLEALERFRILGIEFVSITEAVDTSTAMGKMVFTLLAAVAEFERDLVRERTRAGLDRARAEGKHVGRPRVLIDVQRVAELWNNGKGMSYRGIAEKLGYRPTSVFNALKDTVLKSKGTLSEQNKILEAQL
jgi:DNA invertase Pin-like site-specific DNA recombinase